MASRAVDYLQDLTYAGLTEALGRDCVAEIPFHWQYHRERRFFWGPRNLYPRNLGYVPGPRPALGKNDYDAVILGAAKPDALLTLAPVLESLRAPWFFVDGGDRQDIGGDFEREGGKESLELFRSLCRKKRPAAIFKREIPKGLKTEGVFPLQFSFNPSRITPLAPTAEKDHKVIFWAVESSEPRKKAFKLLQGKYDCDENGSVPGRKASKYTFKGDSYFRALNRTRIVLNLRGAGFDTLRYWEVPASGSLLLSEEPTIGIPDDFTHGKNAVFCRNDLSDMTSLIDHYLAHEDEALGIPREGQKHLLAHHTHRHRAEFILEVMEKQCGLKP